MKHVLIVLMLSIWSVNSSATNVTCEVTKHFGNAPEILGEAFIPDTSNLTPYLGGYYVSGYKRTSDPSGSTLQIQDIEKIQYPTSESDKCWNASKYIDLIGRSEKVQLTLSACSQNGLTTTLSISDYIWGSKVLGGGYFPKTIASVQTNRPDNLYALDNLDLTLNSSQNLKNGITVRCKLSR